MIIAVTGGIGSGKSLLGETLKGVAAVYDADEIVRELEKPSGAAYKPLLKAFGKEYFSPELNRVELGRAVFADPKLREKLNSIVHPLVRAEIEKIGEQAGKIETHNTENKSPDDKTIKNVKNNAARNGGIKDIVFVLVPLLFESGMADIFDAVWLITSDEGARKARAAARDRRLTESDVAARMAAQMPEGERIERFYDVSREVRRPEFNRVIENNGTRAEFQTKVIAAYESIANGA